MGENVKTSLKRCGEGVRLQPLAKIANAQVVELDDYCRVRDFVFIWGGQGVKIGKHCDIQPGVVVWGGGQLQIGDRVSVGPGSVLLTAVYSHGEGLRMVDGLGEGTTKALYGKLDIGNDVYIGANATLMPDIRSATASRWVPGACYSRRSTRTAKVCVWSTALVRARLRPSTIRIPSPCE